MKTGNRVFITAGCSGYSLCTAEGVVGECLVSDNYFVS
jgi:hypothetical protein